MPLSLTGTPPDTSKADRTSGGANPKEAPLFFAGAEAGAAAVVVVAGVEADAVGAEVMEEEVCTDGVGWAAGEVQVQELIKIVGYTL